VKFLFILEEKANFPVSTMCRVLGVSRSGFYAWRARGESPKAQKERSLLVHVKAAFNESAGTYGAPRIRDELRAQGHRVGKKRIAHLMRKHGIRPKQKRRFRVTTRANPDHEPAPNLLDRCFVANEPDRVWVSDITYVWTREGWLYLCVVVDLFSRRVVGWAIDRSLHARLTVRALLTAIQRRAPAPGLIFHSDRGAQYSAKVFRALLDEHGMAQSMSRKGDCWDNAVAESFFATLKTELVQGAYFSTRNDALRAVHNYIEGFYNLRRRHSAVGNVSPAHYEAMLAQQLRVA
jgi:transposase InsO family protein